MKIKLNESSHIPLPFEKLHVSGIGCLLIASKIEDVVEIRVSQLIETAGYGLYDSSSIFSAERDVLSTLEYRTLLPQGATPVE